MLKHYDVYDNITQIQASVSTHQAIKKHVVRAVVAEARQRGLPQDLEELRVEWAGNVKNG